MKRYKVTVHYRPRVFRSAWVEAENPERAMAKALLERRLPSELVRGEGGWFPIYWNGEGWPQILGPDRVTWTDGEETRSVRMEVSEDSDDPSGDPSETPGENPGENR